MAAVRLDLDGRQMPTAAAALRVIARQAGLAVRPVPTLDAVTRWADDVRTHADLAVVWAHRDDAAVTLGYAAAVAYWTRAVRDYPPRRFIHAAHRLRAALRREGPTFLDVLERALAGAGHGHAGRGALAAPEEAGQHVPDASTATTP